MKNFCPIHALLLRGPFALHFFEVIVVFSNFQSGGMFRAKSVLQNLDRPLIKRLDLGIFPLVLQRNSQITVPSRNRGMIWAERLFGHCDRPSKDLFSLSIFTLVPKRRSEIVVMLK